MHSTRLIGAAALCGALLVPTAASAATKKVYLGPPPSPTTKKLQKLGDDPTAFFLKKTTIHTGDKITFVNESFHNVDFPKKGGKPLAFAIPNGTAKDQKDAAGNPFWFNGQPTFGFNPALFADTTPATYDGSKRVAMAFPPVRKDNKYTITFTKKGSYTFYCDIHAGMKGKVVVVPKGAKAPGKKADQTALRKQLKATLAATKRAIAKKLPKNTVSLGKASSVGSEVLAMFPKTLTVKKGTTVKFTMPTTSREIHTASFGADPTTAGSYLKPLADSFGSPAGIDPRASYPSDPKLVGLTSTTHGNGFWNSGILDAAKATPFPLANKVRFDEKGTYTFWCLIHTNMKGTIKVK
jgi:plastocyanin